MIQRLQMGLNLRNTTDVTSRNRLGASRDDVLRFAGADFVG
jgi:hypothetical protein